MSVVIIFMAICRFIAGPGGRRRGVCSTVAASRLVEFIRSVRYRLIGEVSTSTVVVNFRKNCFRLLERGANRGVRLCCGSFCTYDCRRSGGVIFSVGGVGYQCAT